MFREDDAIRMIRDNERLIAEKRQHAKEANQHRLHARKALKSC